jgi:hypothetical protein
MRSGCSASVLLASGVCHLTPNPAMEATAPRRPYLEGDRMAKNISPNEYLSDSSSSVPQPNIPDLSSSRQHAAAAIARSLHRQIDTAWMLLRTADRFPTYEEPHERFVHSSARVLRHAEEQLWKVELEQADLLQLASNIEGLWFAIDAMS